MAESRNNTSGPNDSSSPASGSLGSQKKGDLKDLDLATGVDRVPELWARHGNKVLIGITIVALGYAIWSFKRNSALSAKMTAETNLALARDLITELKVLPLDGESPDRYGTVRRGALSDGTTYLNDVLERSQEESYVAQALLLRGELNYTLANMPEMEAATTRPALGLGQGREKLLGAAKEAYGRLIEAYPGRTRDVGSAHFGLAAVAEDMGDWTAAKTHYEVVANDEKQIKVYRDLAKGQLERLPELARPVRLRLATTRAGATTMSMGGVMMPPTTLPLTTMPAATRPSVP